MTANGNFKFLAASYLFAEVGRRIREYKQQHPDSEIIRMDIGDVTLPVVEPVAEAMKRAVSDMLSSDTFHGYGPEQGYDFLREAIAIHDYASRGVDIKTDEIFVSDGAKCDIGNLTDLMSEDTVVAIPDPVYPVYVDSNIMAGRNPLNGRMVYLPCDPDNYWKPSLPQSKVDVVYLCSPNNPTGSVLDKEDLKKWIDYALEVGAVIIFDSAYEAFIRDPELPKTIYEIEGAREVAVEVRSFSKTAGFTGLRCGYTVVPEGLTVHFPDGSPVQLRKLWLRRQTTKFNGASYIIQKGAEAVYDHASVPLVKANIDYYLRNVRMLRDVFLNLGYEVSGAENSPYIWIRAKNEADSWELFDKLLSQANISCTPGSGFGSAGEGSIRLTGFNSYENTLRAIERLQKL